MSLRPGAADDPDASRSGVLCRSLVEATQLGRAATLAEVGDVAAFVVSDQARTLTATDVNISCGAIVD